MTISWQYHMTSQLFLFQNKSTRIGVWQRLPNNQQHSVFLKNRLLSFYCWRGELQQSLTVIEQKHINQGVCIAPGIQSSVSGWWNILNISDKNPYSAVRSESMSHWQSANHMSDLTFSKMHWIYDILRSQAQLLASSALHRIWFLIIRNKNKLNLMLKSMMHLTLVHEQQPTEKMLVELSQSVTWHNHKHSAPALMMIIDLACRQEAGRGPEHSKTEEN